MTFFLFVAWAMLFMNDDAPGLPTLIIFFCFLASAAS